jgi:hypothetical protein
MIFTVGHPSGPSSSPSRTPRASCPASSRSSGLLLCSLGSTRRAVSDRQLTDRADAAPPDRARRPRSGP